MNTPIPSSPKADLPIGIFDSGVGGLTVLAALCGRLPNERFCYLGDTARLPYGTKSEGTVARYSLQATEKLVERRIKLLVVACNTATAAALPILRDTYAPLPVVGVIEPGARAACETVRGNPDGGDIVVLATEATVRGGAYARAIREIRPEARVTGIPCSLFVSLAEEGWMTGPIAKGIAARYLEPVLETLWNKSGRSGPDCILLGCTHFPPLAGAIAAVAGEKAVLVDSAATTAEAVENELQRLGLLRRGADQSIGQGTENLHFLTTDAPERFARVGSLFLGRRIDQDALELVTL